ncbi:MAG: hypothetical protein A3F54_01855 [Candidatus Kerfeldbacteria bacterium RIFCSPHIGHO2_12_FULL_48_17]|uniref:Glycosyltransferase RgtA/B/C/D-like domain-containing protein n=1 Tax=Candidatus Kerfeldbacteria bacterium RIFCSPHIGHO2_12_FULL_48_17 TaxID=1798542 RepID=A0A1G2B9P0_9BACT|nr:MAG: hypothetical protein A3F54_01855 [Candidatus Kerfeldbacteria bacterium RIFCSPHIGHO2_12_FULL_48_17]
MSQKFSSVITSLFRKPLLWLLPLTVIVFFIVVSFWSGFFVRPNAVIFPRQDRVIANASDWVQALSTTWDSTLYSMIAARGYYPEKPSLFAFFPLFPLEARAIATVFFDGYIPLGIVAAGFLNFFLFCLVLWFFLAQYTKKFHLKISTSSLVVTAVFLPFAFFWIVPYTESLFLFLLMSWFAVLFFSTKKWQLFFLPLLAFALALTRPNGISLAVVIVFFLWKEYWGFTPVPDFSKIRQQWKRFTAVVASLTVNVLGLLAFMSYGYGKTGDFFISTHVQAEWGRGASTWRIWQPIVEVFRALADQWDEWTQGCIACSYWIAYDTYLIIGIALFFLAIIVTLVYFRRGTLQQSLLVFSVVTFVLPLTSQSYQSLDRFAVALPIVFVFIPLWLHKKLSPAAVGLVQAVLVMIWTTCVILYSGHYWLG